MAGSSRKLTVNELLGAYSSTATKDNIKKIQQALAEQGYTMSKSTKKNGQYDGIVGKETRAALDAYMKDAGYTSQPNKAIAESHMQKAIYNTYLTQDTKVADKRKAPTLEEFYVQAEQVRKAAEDRLKTKYGPNVKVDIVQKERTLEQQKALLAKGASQTPFSSHNLGLGADAQITINGVVQSGTTKATIAPYDVLGGAARDAGMFWGWANDPGHFQYNPYPKGTAKNKNYYGYVDEILREHPELADQEITKAFYQTKKTTAPKRLEPVLNVLDSIYNTPTARVYTGEARKQSTLRTPAYAYGGKLPIDMYGRSVRKYGDGGFSSTTGDAIGAIGGIAGGFLSSAGTKQVDKGRIVGGTAMQAAGAVAPIATNPALLTATGGLSALAIPLAAGIGALAGIPKQKKYNRIEDANNIDEGMAMYQGLNQQNNYMQDPIRYAAYGGKINHYGDGGESYDPTTDPNLMKEVVITATRKNIVADMFAGIIENMNATGKAKNRKNNLEVMKTLTAYLQNPVQTSNFLNMSTGKAPAFYGDSNVAQFPGTYMSKAEYSGQQGELAQLEQLNGVKENYVDKYGRTKTTNATESHDSMTSKGKTNMPTDYLQNGDNIFSAKSYSKNELSAILGAYEALTGENVKLGLDVLTPYYNTKSKTTISPADINKVVANKFNPKNLTNNSFTTAAINTRNQTYANLATTKFNDALNPATFQGIAQQGNQQIEQILHAAYGGKMKKYAYGDGPYRMQSPVMIPDIVPPSAEAKWAEAQNLPVELAPPFDKTAWDNRPVNGVYEEWKGIPYTHPGSNTDPFADSGMGPQQEWKGIPYNYPGYNYTSPQSLEGSSTSTNKKSPYKFSSADMAALGVGGANAMASILTLQQKMYNNEVTDKSGVYNMKTELPDNFTNSTLGALRAGLQSNAQNNNWKNTSAMSSEMLSKTVAGLNSALLEQSRQNVVLFNAKQAAIYQALGIDTANKLAWNKDKTALGNYKLSAIGENLLKMASNGNTRAAENELAQMDDATLRAMLVTIGPNSKYFTEQIERIINSRKGK